MQKLLIFLPLLMTCGCQALSQVSQQVTPASTGCPREAKAVLNKEDVKQISLNSETIKQSGQASANKSVGYAFEAKAGQKLSYRTPDDICIWLYTQDNKLLNGGDLPQDGKYILQVSAPKGFTTFNLEMGLGTLSASEPSVSSSPSISSSPDSNSDSNSPTTEASDLTQEQALALVKRWYNAKPRIFAPPFDTSLVDELTTGQLHYETTKSDGSVAWLRNNNSYYSYNYSRINNVVSYSNTGKQPTMTLNIDQELYLHSYKGIDSENSGTFQGKFIYFFEKDSGVWKISNYQKVS